MIYRCGIIGSLMLCTCAHARARMQRANEKGRRFSSRLVPLASQVRYSRSRRASLVQTHRPFVKANGPSERDLLLTSGINKIVRACAHARARAFRGFPLVFRQPLGLQPPPHTGRRIECLHDEPPFTYARSIKTPEKPN